MTLHQILNVYLRLCHNDGTDKPDALYLSLTSKPTCHSELAALLAAADEGKGLSQIHEWYGYEDSEEADHDEEIHTNTEIEKPHDDSKVDEGAQETAHELDEATQDNGPFEVKSHQEVHGAVDTEEKHAEADHEPTPADQEADAETGVPEEAQEIKDDVYEEDAPVGQDDNEEEGHYDSEAQITDSSATVASVSYSNEQNEQIANGTTATTELNDLRQQDEEHADGEDIGHEEGSHQAETDDRENPADFQDTHASEHAAEAIGDHADEKPHVPDAGHEDEEYPAGDQDDGSYEQSESTLEPVPREDAANKEHTPEPEDDLLGIAEDLMQSPAKNRQNGQVDSCESFEQEHSDDDLATPPPPVDDGAADDDADNQQSGDVDNDFDDYYPPPDLEVTEVTEAIELGEEDPSLTDSHTLDNVSTKRSREEEDEWDIAEATTPELKRRRS
jgi:hypothetical protein